MSKVQFKSEQKTEREFVNTLRKNVSDYFKTNHISTKANAAMVFKTVVMVLVYILPFVLLLTVPMPALAALGLCIVMGIGIAGVGMSVMHDACHGAYSRKHWVNDILGGSLYLLGSNVLNWKIQHNVLHHTYTNIAGLDEDIAAKGPIRLAMETPVKKHHKFQFIFAFVFYGMMTIAKLINDFLNLFKYNKKGLVREQHGDLRSEFIKMALRKLVYLAVIFGLPLWLTDFKWYQVLVGFIVMHWVASMILSFVFQLAHVVEGAEQPFEESENYSNWHVHQLRTTSDFARHNKLLGWYVGGLNFQIEHHLFPNICHIHYNKIAPIVQKTALEYGFPYNLKPSFGSAFSSHIKMLKELGVH
ncbi:fatty acid desaturase family protein [Ferruginibacter sp. SUN106]|uniref:fatty acid desaturase family protein n=1 Tax=Ferruginibacter sp. SUN106 TaxID=2978348 RepID=UPI003D35F826